MYTALKGLRHNVNTSYNFGYWQKFDNSKYELIYIEEDGGFDPKTLSYTGLKDAIIFYKCHDMKSSPYFKKEYSENRLLKEADRVFTSNTERHRNENLEWLNWYADECPTEKENDLYEVEDINLANLSKVRKSKIFIVNSQPTSVSKVFFEAFASKTLVLCRKPKNLDIFKTVFEENEHVIYFDSEKDKDIKYKIYSNSEEDLEDITLRALHKLNKFHSPKERSKEIVRTYKRHIRKKARA